MNAAFERIGGMVLLLFSAVYAALSFNIPLIAGQAEQFNPRSMPQALALLGVVVAIALIAKPQRAGGAWPALSWARGFAFLLLMSAYGFLLQPAGFLIATMLFLATGFALMGERRALVLLGTAAVLTGTFWMLMSWVLGVYLSPWPQLLAGAIRD